MGTSLYRSRLLSTGGFSVSDYIQRFAKPDKTEERGAKPKARFCNRAIQAETRISLEDDRGKEKALSKPVERANIDCTTPTQTPCQAVKDSTSLGAQATNQTSGPENADDVHPLPVLDKPSIYNSGNKPSCKLKEVSNQKREPIQTQTLIKDTQNIGLNTEDQYGTEEAEGGHICAVAGGSERDVSAATENGRHKSAATALERILDTPEGSPDTGLQILEASDDETLQASPFSVQPQQPAVEDKKKKKNTRERRKSSKSSVPLPKHKEAECKPHVKVVVAVQKTVSPAKQQEEQNAPQAFSASGLQKDNSTTIEIKAEKLPSQPQSEPMQLLPAGTHQTEPDKLGEKLGEKPEAADNTEIQANKETTGTNPPAVAKSPEPQLVVIDDSPPLPAPFEHRIVSAKQLPVNSYYTVKQNEVLGGGRFGQVLKCAELSSGLTLAAKIIKVKGSKDREEVKNEIGVMNQLNHVNLIQLYDAFESRNNLTLIMEYVEGGELFDRIIDENYQLTELDAIVFTRQICEGVQYLHQQYILHLDLKPENILCVNHTGNQIKIIDFGLARKYKPREKLKVNFGTPEFLAPEVVNYDYVSFPTDMWSVGVITYMLLSGLSPFLGDNDTETMNNILHSNWEFDVDAFENVSAEAKDFISRLLIPERCSRLSASGCMKHDWLNNLADKAKMRRVRLKSQLRLQSYLAHRQWKKHFYVIAAANRLKRFRQGRSVNPA
ncbi:myosin light chain kinase 3 isoform X2 [Amia ocellicauda]|uniref:myosin light chain kinase 3 isoform X2 n=1 Tax=Amia ocellicauda TaxID=2972642 RepID=UPI003463F910